MLLQKRWTLSNEEERYLLCSHSQLSNILPFHQGCPFWNIRYKKTIATEQLSIFLLSKCNVDSQTLRIVNEPVHCNAEK